MKTNYADHVNIMKNLKMNDDFVNARKPFKEDFEVIYKQAKDQSIDISSAKEFLESLSSKELTTLQNYTGLADEINIDKLSNEGAYNLLVHHYEKYDFNNDGIIEDGIAKTRGMIPQSLDNDSKKAMVETFNSMSFKDRMMASIITFPPLKYIDGEIVPSNDEISYDYIKQRIENIFDPKNKNNSTLEFRDTIKKFWDSFELSRNKILEEKEYYKIK
jgi:hypothetical protein